MNEMEYKPWLQFEGILTKGTYKDFHYCIVSFGTHPCCYVFLPKDHKYYGKDCYDININCHGGELTYSNNDLGFSPFVNTKYWVIGWDYMHIGDYVPPVYNGKKWTTKELIKEVKKVINQL